MANAEYIQHLYDLFGNFVGSAKPTEARGPPQVRDIPGGGAKDRQYIRFQTYSHSEFKFDNGEALQIFYPAHAAEGIAYAAFFGARSALSTNY